MHRRSIAAGFIVLFTLLVAGSAAPALAGGGCHGPDGTEYTEGSATVVRMDVCSFEPTVVRVPVGTTVRFLNTAPNDHAVAGRGQTWVSNDVLRPGAEFSERFEEAGIYPYACPLHVGMVGAVIVGEPAAAAGVETEAAAAPVSAEGAETTGSATPEADGTPIVAGAAVGLVGGAIVGVIAAGYVLGRRRAASAATRMAETEA